MTAPTRPTTPAPAPPTPAADPCRNCQTTGGAIRWETGRPYRIRGYCWACYQRALRAGFPAVVPPPQRPYYDRNLIQPETLPAIVTPAMLGIAPGEIGAHFDTAQAQLWADEAGCGLAGAIWRLRHPEQFTPAALARIFGGEPVLAYWGDDAARAA